MSPMVRYVMRRLAQALVVFALLTVIIFVIARLSGDPVAVLAPQGASPAARAALTHDFGLDKPWPVQYVNFIERGLQGDFGDSVRFQAPALDLVLERLPHTLLLSAVALALALLVGIPLGLAGAAREGRPSDHLAQGLLTIGQAAPSFWVAILLILVFGVDLRWLPFIGDQGLESVVLPAVTLALLPAVTIARVTRSSMIGVLPQDYVRTARAKGLRPRVVTRRHVMRNGLIPVVTIIGLLTGELLSGAVITEQIFSWPGIGSLAIQAIEARDYTVVQTVTLLAGAIVIALNLLVDFSYLLIDPRLRATIGRRA